MSFPCTAAIHELLVMQVLPQHPVRGVLDERGAPSFSGQDRSRASLPSLENFRFFFLFLGFELRPPRSFFLAVSRAFDRLLSEFEGTFMSKLPQEIISKVAPLEPRDKAL